MSLKVAECSSAFCVEPKGGGGVKEKADLSILAACTEILHWGVLKVGFFSFVWLGKVRLGYIVYSRRVRAQLVKARQG